MVYISRDTKFRSSFQHFMANHPTYEDCEYEIRCNTTNTRVHTHIYDILFPLEKQIGVIDSDGLKPPKPIYMVQHLPSNSIAIDDFKKFYEPYIKYDNDSLIYGTNITNIDENTEYNKVTIISLAVKYPKNKNKNKKNVDIPYLLSPVHQPQIDSIIQTSYVKQIGVLIEANCKLLHQNSVLSLSNDKHLDDIKRINSDLNKQIDDNYNLNHIYMTELSETNVYIQLIKECYTDYICTTKCNYIKLTNNYRKLYENHNIIDEDCPVCYEQLKPTNLVSPICGHSICSSCIVNCNSICPLCREYYHGFDSLFT